VFFRKLENLHELGNMEHAKVLPGSVSEAALLMLRRGDLKIYSDENLASSVRVWLDKVFD
jgi:hypothetical protein